MKRQPRAGALSLPFAKALSTRTRSAIVLLAALIATEAFPAADGERGGDSLGDIRIALAIQPNIQIDRLEDIQLRIVDRTQDFSFAEEFCISGNQRGRYTVVAIPSATVQGRFALLNSEGSSLGYDVLFKGMISQQDFDQLAPGIPSPSYDLTTSRQSCGGEDSSAFQVEFNADDLQEAQSGLYTGFLTLLVSPV